MNRILFDKEYFMDGVRSGRSNYENYRWLPDLTIPAALRLVERLGIRKGETIADYGAARGFLVKAFRFIGFEAWGYDISQWAVDNAPEDVREYMSTDTAVRPVDWVICKDCAEHIPQPELRKTVAMFLTRARKGILIVVPLAERTGGMYVSDRDNQDVTHVIRWTLCDWLKFLQRIVDESGLPFTVNGAYKQPGLKEDITSHTPSACGFLTLRRYEL